MMKGTGTILMIIIGALFVSTYASAQSNWPKAERMAFMSNCVKEAEGAMGEDMATEYCFCMLGKVTEVYPKPEDALDMDMDQIKTMASDCFNLEGWDEEYQDAFLSSCINSAVKNTSEEIATDFCSCMLVKLMLMYPDPEDTEDLSDEDISAISEGCQ